MRRTIRMRDDRVSIGGRTYELLPSHRRHFNLENSRNYKYVVIITKGGEYTFKNPELDVYPSSYYTLYHKHERLGIICKRSFHKVFFKPDPEKMYNIIVKKVKIKRKKK